MKNLFAERITFPAGERQEGGKMKCLFLHTILANGENAGACAAKLENILGKTEPDFLLFAGDITEKQTDAEALENLLRLLLAPVIRRNLPWAHVFGDKDRVNALEGEAQMAVYRKIPGCRSMAGEESVPGCGNYILPLYRGDEPEPAFLLWCMDSHDHVQNYEREYGSATRARLANPLYTEYYNDGIRFHQTMWYHHTALALEKQYGRKIPGMMCFHIPTPEHVLIPKNQGRTRMQGQQWEAVSCHTVNGGIFSAVFEHRDVEGIYCGNSRQNRFSGIYGGITLAQTPSFRDSEDGYALVEIAPDAEQKIRWMNIECITEQEVFL